jgi:hypothetical protein
MEGGMSRLLHDRYYAYAAEHAWDLATGESVPLAEMTSPLLVSTPLADPLVEVLDHGERVSPVGSWWRRVRERNRLRQPGASQSMRVCVASCRLGSMSTCGCEHCSTKN